ATGLDSVAEQISAAKRFSPTARASTKPISPFALATLLFVQAFYHDTAELPADKLIDLFPKPLAFTGCGAAFERTRKHDRLLAASFAEDVPTSSAALTVGSLAENLEVPLFYAGPI